MGAACEDCCPELGPHLLDGEDSVGWCRFLAISGELLQYVRHGREAILKQWKSEQGPQNGTAAVALDKLHSANSTELASPVPLKVWGQQRIGILMERRGDSIVWGSLTSAVHCYRQIELAPTDHKGKQIRSELAVRPVRQSCPHALDFPGAGELVSCYCCCLPL